MIRLKKYYTYTIENCVMHNENAYYMIRNKVHATIKMAVLTPTYSLINSWEIGEQEQHG